MNVVGFCCAVENGRFINMRGAVGENCHSAQMRAMNMLYVECDSNISRWFGVAAERMSNQADDSIEIFIDVEGETAQ
jgi:hypothetical protein